MSALLLALCHWLPYGTELAHIGALAVLASCAMTLRGGYDYSRIPPMFWRCLFTTGAIAMAIEWPFVLFVIAVEFITTEVNV